MVKGTTKQVVLVRPAGHKLFEQAIFFVRDDQGITQEQMMAEAKKAAQQYVRTKISGGRQRFSWLPLAYFGSGAAVASLVWMLV